MDDACEKIVESDSNLNEIRSNYQEINLKIDSLTRSMRDFDSRLADVEDKRIHETVSFRPKTVFSTSLHSHTRQVEQKPGGRGREREYNNLPCKMHCDSIITRSCWIED